MSDLRHATTTEKRASPESKLGSYSPSVFAAAEPLRVGVINNPLSGRSRRGLGAVKKVLAVHPQVPHRDVQTPADVASALVDFARKEVNIVVVNGGDGTVQEVLTVLFHRGPFESLPLLAVLRAGTTNMTAGDIGLKGSPSNALLRLLSWLRSGEGEVKIVERSVLRVQAPPNGKPIYGMFLGAAGIYRGIQFCRSKIHTLGLRGELGPGLALFLLMLMVKGRKNSGFVTSEPVTVKLDQRLPEEHNFLLLLISTLERLFLGLRPYWGAEKGPLHYSAVRYSPEHLLRVLPFLLFGRRSRYATPENGYFSHNVQEVELTFDSGFTVDGEFYSPDASVGPVLVQNGGRATFVRL